MGPIARGLLIAIPVLFVFASLFSAADVAFDRLMGRLFAWNVDLGEVPIRLSVAFLIAWGVAGLAGRRVRRVDDGRPTTPTRMPSEPLPQSLGAAALGLPDERGAAARGRPSGWGRSSRPRS